MEIKRDELLIYVSELRFFEQSLESGLGHLEVLKNLFNSVKSEIKETEKQIEEDKQSIINFKEMIVEVLNGGKHE